ncbi:MAG: hypothetical protein L6R45_29295 [Anaerolineae bacterium]|nr:hypothetical protein [Anaerolineae bacterium]
MPKFTLTALDVSGIQRYIFNSNRLQENVGASELVHRATNQFVFQNLPSPHNITNNETGELDDSLLIEVKKSNLAAEVIYAGGGNTLILFKNKGQAKSFVTALSQKLLIEAPGLELLAAHVEVDWDNQPLGDSQQGRHKAVMDELARVKNRRPVSASLLGLGVTASCQSTGLAAVAMHPHKTDYPISAEVNGKLEAVELAQKRFKALIGTGLPGQFQFPLEFDEFGRSKGEISYIAVVHADGNGMGARIRKMADKHKNAGDESRKYIQAIRDFSRKINQASLEALNDTISVLAAAVANKTWLKENKFSIRERWLPFRPLVFGGDDVTFVCDGRLGLTLAVHYLNAFAQKTAAHGINGAYACAGIAVVKTHYPFARAYQLAEQLCSSAKNYVRQTRSSLEEDFSALDWHFAASGLLGSLDEIRANQYEVKEGKLYLRPVRLSADGANWRTWPNFSQVTQEFNRGEQWADKRNKVMALRQALRGGEVAVSQFLKAYEIKHLPAADKLPTCLPTTGWTDGICGYFDPIEAMDFFVPLESSAGGN